MKILIVCCLLVGPAVSSPPGILANYIVDKLCEDIAKRVQPNIRYPPFVPGEIEGIKYNNVKILGLDSVIRTGPSFISETENSIHFDMHIGLSHVTVMIPSMEIEGHNMSGKILLSGLSAHYQLSLRKHPCKVLPGGNVTLDPGFTAKLYSSDPKYNRDMTSFFMKDPNPIGLLLPHSFVGYTVICETFAGEPPN